MSRDILKHRNAKNFEAHGHDSLDKATVRETLLGAANTLVAVVPEGRELATALTKLEEAMFWAAAGIGRVPLETDGNPQSAAGP